MDYQGSSATRGMAVMDELQKHRAAMAIIGDVIAALQAQDGPLSTAQALRDAYEHNQ